MMATRFRPLVYRLLTARNPVFNKLVVHYVPAKCRLQPCVGDSLAAVRYVATITTPQATAVSQERKSPTRTPFPNTSDRSERILWHLNQSPVSLYMVSFNDLRAAIDSKLTAENAMPWMTACSRLLDRSVDERVELIDRIWKYVVKSSDSGAPLPYHLLIGAYRACGKSIDDPHTFLTEIGAPQTAEIYDELLVLLSENNRSIDAAIDLLKHMNENGLTATERAYNALIVGVAAHTKSLPKCEAIVTEMHRRQVTETLDTTAALIKANIECGDGKKAIEMLKQHSDWNSHQLYPIIRLAALKCTGPGVVKSALHLLPAPIFNAKLIAVELQNICIDLLHASNADRYYDPYELIIEHLPQPVFRDESTDEYGLFLIKEMLSSNVALPRIVQFCEQLIASERNTRAIHRCCGFAIGRNLSNAHDLLRHLATKEPLRPHYFWPLLATAESEERVFEIIKLAISTNTELDAETIEKHILSNIPHTVNDSMLALKTLEEMGIKMHTLRSAMISHLLEKDRPHEALNVAKSYAGRIDAVYIKNAITSFITRNQHAFKANAMTVAQLIRTIQFNTTNRQYDLAGHILHDISMHRNEFRQRFVTTSILIQDLTTAKVRISAAAAEAVLNRMSKQRDVYASSLEKVRAMIDNEHFPKTSVDDEKQMTSYESIQAMENHLIELESKKLNTRGILRKLFLQCIKERKFERALELHKKCIEEKVEISPAMMASVITLMTNLSNEREALHTINTMLAKYPRFTIDLHKIIDLAKLLVQKDHLRDAEQLLQRFASATAAANTNYVRKNVWELLQAVADYSVRNKCSKNMAQAMLDKVVQLGYGDITNNNLGPIIREYIAKGQIDAAVTEFERIADEFRLAPQLLTLMTLLIDLMNADEKDKRWELYDLNRPKANERLRRVVDVARKTQKPELANTNLLTAFAISGNDQQIRKVLMNPAMQLDIEQLVNNLEHQVNTTGKIEVVIRLARANRGLRHEAINEEKLYTLVLNQYVTENNHAAALNFYTSICKDVEYKMSTKLKQTFDDLFARNNVVVKR